MLKLMKFELLDYYHRFFRWWLLSLLIYPIAWVVQFFPSKGIFVVLQMLTAGFAFIGIICITGFTLLFSICKIIIDLRSDTSQLYFTTPVKPIDIVASKILVTVIYLLFAILSGYVGTIILATIYPDVISYGADQIDVIGIASMLLAVAAFIGSLITAAFLARSFRFSKRSVDWFTFLFLVVLMYIGSQFHAIVDGLFGADMRFVLGVIITKSTFSSEMGNLIGMLVACVQLVIYLTVSSYLLKKRVDL